MVVYSQQTKFDIKGGPFPTFAERGREGSKITRSLVYKGWLIRDED